MYIVLEGIDGVGKTTQTEKLKEWLEKRGFSVKTIVEPTDSDIGKIIREELLKPEATSDTSQQMLALLFAADRLTLKDEINQVKNNQQKILISDRSFYSSITYQNSTTIEPEWIYKINKHTPRPDLTIILDIDEDEALKRCDKIDTFENKEFLEKTRENYLKLVKTEKNIVKIDATPTEDVVQDEIRNQIIKYLKL
ncbi:dTMP kinase [uncultured Methanosphaera sp.]|uniref:dTMP kinase n=1 Tax=uncultured Methanosphaera sp. TaxID=262501 RepID=UPI0025977FF4|nr:dTMP kinase [uncultured Methanosphaera sp.]